MITLAGAVMTHIQGELPFTGVRELATQTRNESYLKILEEGTNIAQCKLLKSIYERFGALSDREVLNINESFGCIGTVSARRNELIKLGQVEMAHDEMGKKITTSYLINGKHRTAQRWGLIEPHKTTL